MKEIKREWVAMGTLEDLAELLKIDDVMQLRQLNLVSLK